MTDRQDLPPLSASLPRLILRLGIIAALIWVVIRLLGWVGAVTDRMPDGQGEMIMLGLLISLLLAYAILMATPYVPGIEIGISLLVMKGAAVAPFVYLATVIGLTVAYLAGRFLSYDWLHKVFADLRLRRACDLLEAVRPLSREERLERLRARLPDWARALTGPGRYLALALLLNLPGNGLIGGGGGICLIAGLSRLFGTRGTIIAIALGVAPVPLLVWLFGAEAYLDAPSNQ
jgi:hypothetical protein